MFVFLGKRNLREAKNYVRKREVKPREVSDWQSEKGNQRKCESKREKE